MTDVYQRPFLKYAGNKYPLLVEIVTMLPTGRRLIDPFAGSAVVGLNATRFESVWVNDINPDLINLYQHVCHDDFITRCLTRFTPRHNNRLMFDTIKGQFNYGLPPLDRAAVFVYLNRHCFNGLCRYNRKGEFNVSFGRYGTVKFPRQEIRAFQAFCNRATFTCLPWEEVMLSAVPGDVIYCDPPYLPLSDTSNFSGYAGNVFGRKESERLNKIAAQVAARGIPVIVSNNNTEDVRRCFANRKAAKVVTTTRTISSKSDTRGDVEELLMTY